MLDAIVRRADGHQQPKTTTVPVELLRFVVAIAAAAAWSIPLVIR